MVLRALFLSGRVTLDPTERHGFDYQSWFGFTIYADGLRGALGRGGAYFILDAEGSENLWGPAGEPATGFSLYLDELIDALAGSDAPRDTLFLPLGHNAEAAARLRAVGWRTLAALSEADEAAALGCTHRLDGKETVRI